MKTRFLFPALLLAGFSAAQTTVYHSFPDSNAVWHIHEYPQGGSDIHYQYGIIGDTVLNGISWHKVYLEENCLQNPTITTGNSTLIGAIREDESKRVFFYSIGYFFTDTDSTYLLYDFSAEPGDTIHYDVNSVSPPAYPQLIVNSTDSVWAAGQYRKRFYLGETMGGNTETWIEGIGSLRDLFSPVTPYPLCECLHELFCFRQEDITYYLKPGYSDCYNLSAGLSEHEQSKGTLFPNPSTANATISLPEPATNALLEVFDLQGKSVHHRGNLSGETITAEVDGLRPGMYFVRLTQGNELLLEEKLLLENRK